MDAKAVPGVPFYLSQANQEFLGTPVGYASTTMAEAGVPIPGYVSALAGRSSGNSFTVGHAYDFGDYFGWMTSYFTAGAMNPTTIEGVGQPMKDFFATNSGSVTGSCVFASDPGVHIDALLPNGITYRFSHYSNGICSIQGNNQSFFDYLASRNGQTFAVKFTAVPR